MQTFIRQMTKYRKLLSEQTFLCQIESLSTYFYLITFKAEVMYR